MKNPTLQEGSLMCNIKYSIYVIHNFAVSPQGYSPEKNSEKEVFFCERTPEKDWWTS